MMKGNTMITSPCERGTGATRGGLWRWIEECGILCCASKTEYNQKRQGRDCAGYAFPPSRSHNGGAIVSNSFANYASSLAHVAIDSQLSVSSHLDEGVTPQVIVSDDGTQQLLQSIAAFIRSIPAGHVARWEKSNEYGRDGDLFLTPTRTIHLHTGTHKRLSKYAACGLNHSSHWMSKRHRCLEMYADDPSAGVDYRVCPKCWDAVKNGGVA